MARSDALDRYFSESLCLSIDPKGIGRHILGVRHGAMSREDVVGGDMYEEDVSLLADFGQSCYCQVIDFICLLGLIFGTVDSRVSSRIVANCLMVAVSERSSVAREVNW